MEGSAPCALLLLALLLTAPIVTRAGRGETATVPCFGPSPCLKLPGAEELAKANCGYLVVPDDRSQPNGRTIRPMVREIPPPACREPLRKAAAKWSLVSAEWAPSDDRVLEAEQAVAQKSFRGTSVFLVGLQFRLQLARELAMERLTEGGFL